MALNFRQLLLKEKHRIKKKEESQIEANKSPIANENSLQLFINEHVDQYTDDENLELTSWIEKPEIALCNFQMGLVDSIYYIPNWITSNEESSILERVYNVPKTTKYPWVTLKYRRLRMWGGNVNEKICPIPLPTWLNQISKSLVSSGIFQEKIAPNHVLVNEYGEGDCILPHEDGPMYTPLVAIISTGADATVTFTRHRELNKNKAGENNDDLSTIKFSVERRSLLVFTGQAYTHYLHGIDDVKSDKRISLTIRHVPMKKIAQC